MTGRPVVLTPNAANRVRAAVTAISMASRPYGVVTSSSARPGAQALPMPFDLRVAPVEVSSLVEQHAMVRIAGAFVFNGGSSLPLYLTGGANASLSAAISGGLDDWDAGALTEQAPTIGLCLYVLVVVRDTANGNRIRFEWGIAAGATVAAAIAAIPAASGTGSAAGDILGTLVCVPLGYASTSLSPAVAQLWRGVVATPLLAETTVMVDFQYELSSHKLQKKTRSALSPAAMPESAFTTVTGGTAEAHS